MQGFGHRFVCFEQATTAVCHRRKLPRLLLPRMYSMPFQYKIIISTSVAPGELEPSILQPSRSHTQHQAWQYPLVPHPWHKRPKLSPLL